MPQDDPRLDPLKILNPLGEDSSVMRPTLAPDMLKTLSFNMSRGTAAASLYEAAAVFDKHRPTAEGLPTETQTLCLGSYGEGADFYAVRGAAEAILCAQGIEYTVEPGADAYYHPGRCATLTAGDTAYRHGRRGAPRRAGGLRHAKARRDRRDQPGPAAHRSPCRWGR